ncbi:hypothetical protein ACJ8PQ_18895, partial [Serratia sp. CY74664]
MEIDVREINARPATEYRYRITVYKNAGAAAAYYLDFKKATLRMRQWLIGAYPTSEILDNAYAIELYDVKALEVRAEVARSLFDPKNAAEMGFLNVFNQIVHAMVIEPHAV